MEQEEAFKQLKIALITAPVLARPDFTKEFKLYTDASAIGLGAILAQGEKDEERVIAYASRGTRGAEKNYGSTQLECLAVVWAVELFRHYLLGRHFTVITDHSALQWLFNINDPSRLHARWIMRMQVYDMTVTYRAGRKHQNVDTLS